MTALAKERKLQERDGKLFVYPVAANTVIYAGAMVVIAGGVARPATYATPSHMIGVAEYTADNTGGAAGDVEVCVRRGVFAFNSAAAPNAVDMTMVAGAVVIMDDQTIAKPATSGGIAHTGFLCEYVDSDGVWIRI